MGFGKIVKNALNTTFDVVTLGQADNFKYAWNELTGKNALDRQNELNMQAWNMQNEYNTPANQMKRWLEAGLNPNLIYSQGNAGNASSMPHLQAHQTDYGKFFSWLSTIYALKNMKAQNANLQAQTDNIEAQTRYRNAEADYQEAVMSFYRKYGYFPGASIPNQVINRVLGSPLMEHSSDALGSFVGKIITNPEGYRRDFSPERLGRDKVRKLVEKGYVYDRNSNQWYKW